MVELMVLTWVGIPVVVGACTAAYAIRQNSRF